MDVQKVSLINLKKIVLSLTGGALIGIGAGTILYAGIGGDTVTVFQDGLHALFNISYGQASRIYNVVFVEIGRASCRERV